MHTNSRFLFFALIVFLISFQSCSEDPVLSTDNFSDTTENRRNSDRNNDGPPDGEDTRPPRGQDVDRLDTEVLTEWATLFLELDRYSPGMRPTSTARAIAYINLAAYEVAQPGMPDYESNSGHLVGLEISNSADADQVDWEIALNSCYAVVMDHFLFTINDGRRARITTLQDNLLDELSEGVDDAIVSASIAWGQTVAEQVIAYSQTDEEAEQQILNPQPLTYVPPTGLGYWTFSAEPERALFPYWGSVRTFVISPDEASSIPPIEYSAEEDSPYFEQMMECYTSNNEARDEDGEALWIAEFWSDDVEGLMFSPPARQISIANQLVENFDMSLSESLYLFLKVGLSLNDAGVISWQDKYEHMVMRPSVFIQDYIDPTYQTNLYRLIPWPNPSFPGYPSGHSCFASAAAGVFKAFFGDRIDFTDNSHAGRTEFRGTPRNFRSFDQMARENAFSRVPLGVHMSMDCTEGLRLGYEISDAVNNYRLRRRGA